MHPGYIYGPILIVVGLFTIKIKNKTREWAVRRNQADIDTFPKTPILTPLFKLRKDFSQKYYASITVILGTAAILIGILAIISAILGKQWAKYN